MSSAVSCGSGQEPCNSEQIVGGANQIGVHLHPLAATVGCFAQTSDGLHPAKGFLDAFPDPWESRGSNPLRRPDHRCCCYPD
jgi:hypothetical protein